MERLLKLSKEISTLNHSIEEGKLAERQREDLIVEYEDYILKEAERIKSEQAVKRFVEKIRSDARARISEYKKINLNKVSEICPWCEREVILKNKIEIQKCPNCGKEIKPCSLCEKYKEEI